MKAAERIRRESPFQFYHKRSILTLIDFKDIGISLVLTTVLFAVIFAILVADGFDPVRIIHAFAHPDSQTLSDVFGNAFGGMMVGVMALVITVVAFVVQMAANRYTARVVDLFISNRINLSYMTLAAVTTVYVIILLFLGDASPILPEISIFIAFLLVSLLIISIFPYFIFIFRFIKPSNIIYNIEKDAFANILRSYQIKTDDQKARNRALKLHGNWLGGVNQLTDITLNCIQNKDQILAVECIRSLRYLMMNYLKIQARRPLPSAWLAPSSAVMMDVAFITLAEENAERLEKSHLWVEDKILKQVELVFRLSLNQDRTVCNYIANSLYLVGCLAVDLHNAAVGRRVVMYFNTLLRATINAEDIRTCFNTLNQYRKLAEKFTEAGEGSVVLEIVGHFKYYGLLAKEQKGMDFILETVAHDLCDIGKKAFECGLPREEEILDTFLTVDMPIEGAKLVSLRGIRLAQIRLAVYYLSRGTESAEAFARKIYRDMLDELHRPGGYERLFTMIRELKISKKEYWEINDREYNFSYIPTGEKNRLAVFLRWFQLRLVILFGLEYSLNQNPAKAMEYLNDMKAVEKMLPAETQSEESEFAVVLGEQNLDTKNNYVNNVIALEEALSADTALAREIACQGDLDEPRLSENLPALMKGISSFFRAFEAL